MKQTGGFVDWIVRGALLIAVAAVAGCSAGAIDAVELEPGALFEGLVAHWTFDDTGATLTDVGGSHHDGTLLTLTGTTWIPGQPGFGGALHFDGTDQSEVQVPAFPQPTGSWSVAGWIRAPDISTVDLYATVISTEIPVTSTGPKAGGWELNMRIGTPTDPVKQQSLYQYAYWQGPDSSSYSFAECDCFVQDAWAHIAGVFDKDAQTISVYRNGRFANSVSSKPPHPAILPGTEMLYIGAWSLDTTRRLLGDLDDFVIYNRALTQPEVQQLSRAPLPATPPP